MRPGQLVVGDIFLHAARAVPDRLAASIADESITFRELQRAANVARLNLVQLGIGHGDRVAVWSDTTLSMVPLFAACAQAGAVFVPFSPHLGRAETADVVAVARPNLIITDSARADVGAALATECGANACTIEDMFNTAATSPKDDGPGVSGLSETDPHVVFFTSGTTGAPKGVVLSHRTNVLRTYPGAQFEPRGIAVCVFPLFHMAAWTIALQQWQARDGVVFIPAATAATVCTAIERHRATRINAVPVVWRRVLDYARDGANRGGTDVADLSSIRFADTGTSATPPELLDAIMHALPSACVRVFYGSTEAGNVATLEHDMVSERPGRVGVPSLQTELRIDPAGELWVRSPLLFDGYFENEDATAHALVDGWYRTGDLAEFDQDGYLAIVGPARDVIRTGGETVAPAEVEAVVSAMPGIDDVAIVGLPDVEWGEIVCAVVVVTSGHPAPDIEQLRVHCDGRLAAFKQPRRIVTVDEIPRTATTGQTQRRLIVERLLLANG